MGAQTRGVAVQPIAFTPGNLSRGAGASPNEVVQTLKADIGRGTSDQNPHVLAFAMRGRADGNVPEVNDDGTVNALRGAIGGSTRDHVLCTTGHVTPTLNMGAHTAAPGSNGQDALEWAAITVPLVGRPRRLTPLECERLQSWPDQWTAFGVKEDGTAYALSDTARYRLCGNGVGSVVAAWIARRLVWAELHPPFAAPRRTETR